MSDISSEIDEIKKALKKDFDTLLVKEFTTDWQIQRLKIGLDIDVMSLDNLLHLIQLQKEELIARFEEIIGEDEDASDAAKLHTKGIGSSFCGCGADYSLERHSLVRNQLRAEQRQALKELL